MTVERDGAVVAALTYSGEVYNVGELHAELRGYGHEFRTSSDTEVVRMRTSSGARPLSSGSPGYTPSDCGMPRRMRCCWCATGWGSSRCTTGRCPRVLLRWRDRDRCRLNRGALGS